MYTRYYFRQQERHLGIIKSLDAPTTRKKHDVHSFVVNKDSNINQLSSQSSNTALKYFDIHSSLTTVESINTISTSATENTVLNTEILHPFNITRVAGNVEIFSTNNISKASLSAKIKATKINEVESWILVTPTVILRKREVSDREDLEDNKEEMIDIPLEADSNNGNGSSLFKREIIKPDQQPPVQVHIQNITEVNNWYIPCF